MGRICIELNEHYGPTVSRRSAPKRPTPSSETAAAVKFTGGDLRRRPVRSLLCLYRQYSTRISVYFGGEAAVASSAVAGE